MRGVYYSQKTWKYYLKRSVKLALGISEPIFYFCSISQRWAHTLVQVEPVCIESVFRPVEPFCERLNDIASTNDTSAFWSATEQLNAESFADSWQTFLSIHYL